MTLIPFRVSWPRLVYMERNRLLVRHAAVAGSFYPENPRTLEEAVRGFLRPADAPVRALGIVVPHAGYVYSGHVAGEVYSSVDLPRRLIILGPNHTGAGAPLAIMSEGQWKTPLGEATIDRELATSLKRGDPDLTEDPSTHRMEHALEVQLPFIQCIRGSDFLFVPIAVGTSDLETIARLGRAMAAAVEAVDEPVLIIASSDMNHYESDEATRVKDRRAIDRVLDRDPEGLHEVVLREGISMCGFGPATSMLVAVNRLGASRADLAKYATSGDIFGERERVVGYAGIVVS